ncbi:tetratricopeptide repeat protein [Candidatus Daviesbacteria bacterium]|nr:tetratricopeptide repeat protein [Candidatus Daviesbacteria bacterium]
MLNWFKKHWPSLTLLLTLTLITYGNSLNNVFLSDDLAEIANNPNVGSLKYAISAHPFGFIRLILYWLAFQIGLVPMYFRLINLFFHIGSVILIYALLNLLFSKRLALIVTSIFAVHPAISEAIVWISGGMYPQYTFFFLLSLLFYLKSKEKIKYYFAALISFIFTFMSHPQMPLSLFIVFPVWEFLFGNIKKNWKKSVPFLIITIFFLLVTLTGISERENTLKNVHYQERGVDSIFFLIPTAITSYFELIFYPKVLTLYHSELNFSQLGFIIRILITLVFFGAVGLSYIKNKYIFFWLSLFLIALSPTLTPFRLNWIVAERYLYLPILGILVVSGLGITKLAEKLKLKWLDYSIVIIILILLSTRTIIRNIDWKNEDNLWIATGKTSPSSPNTHNNLGDVYGRQGDKQKALQEFQTAIALKPNYADAYHNAANTYVELGQPDQALEYYQKATQFNPNLWQSYQNMAAIYFKEKQYEKALENIQKAITINPNNLNLRLNLGIVYLNMGEKNKAKEIFNLILTVDPQNQAAQAGLAEANK